MMKVLHLPGKTNWYPNKQILQHKVLTLLEVVYPSFPHLTQSQIQQQCLNDGRNGYGVFDNLLVSLREFDSTARPFGKVFS
jgi:hypothetical protein